jgi:lysophospholipase L1-like esterase
MSAQDKMNTTTKKAANSIVGKLTRWILSGAAAVLLGFGLPVAAQAAPQSVLVVGDSLQVGTGPYLERDLRAANVEIDSRQSRGSLDGLASLRSRLRPDHTVVVFDLGTNDDPRNPDALYTTMNEARQVAGDRCLVVATVLRPPYNGVSVDGMNAAIERFASDNPGVQLVDWYGVATSTRGILYEDGVHARPEGYALRGRLVAEGVRACGGGGADVTGIPAPRGAGKLPPAPPPEPEPAPEPEVRVETPAALVAIGSAVRHAWELVDTATGDARRAAGLGPPEPVLGDYSDR